MNKPLKQLLSVIKPIKVIGDVDKNITGVESDSRKAARGTLFVAVPGVTTDGHKYIPDVERAGATAIVCQRLP